MGNSWLVDTSPREAPKPRGKPPPSSFKHYGPVLDREEAEKYLKMSARAIYRLVKAKKLRRIKGTRKILFAKSELDRFIHASTM